MGVAEFRKLIAEEKAAAAKRPPVDWNARRAEWIESVHGLYETIERFLHEFTIAGDVQVRRRSVELEEEYLGRYQTEAMTITVFAKSFELTPRGRNIIGARGRVDLRGPFGQARRLILSREHAEQWEITPADQAIPREKLTKASFLETLSQLGRGDVPSA
jgi:hypothetical protein